MAVTPDFWTDLRGKLESVRPVTHKRMFGGIGLYLEGPVFGIVDNDRLFFKVDAENIRGYDEAGSEMWMYDPVVGPIPKYREVPTTILNEPEKLGEWMDASAAAALRMDSGKRVKKT